ncbi:MAG TPA: hypothetical protein VFE84_01740, partial [Patescibacteria group bacterium]|nr:hypothetical protein [Patescibacteria group bacterium]
MTSCPVMVRPDRPTMTLLALLLALCPWAGSFASTDAGPRRLLVKMVMKQPSGPGQAADPESDTRSLREALGRAGASGAKVRWGSRSARWQV